MKLRSFWAIFTLSILLTKQSSTLNLTKYVDDRGMRDGKGKVFYIEIFIAKFSVSFQLSAYLGKYRQLFILYLMITVVSILKHYPVPEPALLINLHNIFKRVNI
jgi:hypothetical protein